MQILEICSKLLLYQDFCINNGNDNYLQIIKERIICQVIIIINFSMYDSLNMGTKLIDPNGEIFRVGLPIANGNYGAVYQGFDKKNNRRLALKLVDNDANESWKKQIATLNLFDHPNIIKCYGHIPQIDQIDHTVKKVYIVTQFVSGVTLSNYIKKNFKALKRGLTEDLVFKLFMQLIEGFEHIHSRNYVHRDIKPQNILIDEDQNIKIIDFGQSKQRKLLKTKRVGTPLYNAPESFLQNVPGDFRRDVWSLGLVLYQMINGTCIFGQKWVLSSDEQGFMKHLKEITIVVKFPKNFSPIWTQLAVRMLHKEYKKRINLHEIKFQLKKRQVQFRLKFAPFKTTHPILQPLIKSNISRKMNLISQSADQFQINRTKRFLDFFIHKHKFLILLKDHLNKFSYPFLSNGHKLILVFMCLCTYVSALDHLLKRLQKNRIKISQNQQYDANQYDQPYQSYMKESLQTYKEFLCFQSRFTKDFIFERVIPRFSPNFESKSQSAESNSEKGTSTCSSQKKDKQYEPCQLINRYPEVKVILQNFKEGINFSKAHYMEKIRQIVFSKDFFHSRQHLQKYFYQQDILVYYLMMIVAHLDQLKWESQNFDGNVLPKLRQQLFYIPKQKDEILQLINKIQHYISK